MIDHVLGRPSVKFRKIQVFAVVSFWSLYLLKGNIHGPPAVRFLSNRLSLRLTAWQTFVITMLWLYVARNFAKLTGLECPEPLANLYTRAYFRATWVTTALDAGFWTAMRIRKKWLRDLASIIFSIYYLFAAEQADEKVRKVRGALSVDHLRVSWNKSTTPYLSLLGKLLRPRFCRYPPRAVRIPRPRESSYKESVNAWLYFDGPLSALKDHTCLVLDIPGGGYVAMDPRTNDDKLFAWAGKTGRPVLSLDYKKAPEYPYPYALNECYDVYHTLLASRGRCIGMSGEKAPTVVISGDSAGGTLAAGVVLMIAQSASTIDARYRKPGEEQPLAMPEGLVLIYPGLDMNIGNWMTDEQMSLIKDRRVRKTNKNILRRKSEDYNKLTPSTPHHSDEEDETSTITSPPQRPQPNGPDGMGPASGPIVSPPAKEVGEITHEPLTKSPVSTRPSPEVAHLTQPASISVAANTKAVAESKPQMLRTRLAMSSMISYFNDRILTPEMMRAMIILYVGPHARPDFRTDFLLSPLLAPESLLAQFPKTYFLTGERDPLVDDTVIFAGRIRQAKRNVFVERQELGLINQKRVFDELDVVEVLLVPGISHGFMQFVGVFSEGWKYIFKCASWMQESFRRAESASSSNQDDRGRGQYPTSATQKDAPAGVTAAGYPTAGAPNSYNYRNTSRAGRHHRRTGTMESSGDEDRPLEMSIISARRGRGDYFSPRRRGSGTGTPVNNPNASGSNNASRQRQARGAGGAPVGAAEGTDGTNSADAGSRSGTKSGLGSESISSLKHAALAQIQGQEQGRPGSAPVYASQTSHPVPPSHLHHQHNPPPPTSDNNNNSNIQMRRKVSLVSLASEDDLLNRRMIGLAGGLMGNGDGLRTP
ncbi:alpha/beta-hydrolase [Xylona heveae TC161]|uniref:Alpha/beta-hydrolase n=1 Tax=Xylona heveae (strain CBS 132557 / TC161) TaxID=1328760 RepID=A0A165A335_XYLHT|nr:alpha/beta-hydrolase [Xylona heveae TC161]KZF19886.1 alpha/beta-hydrolase [Xylona heveae TC161]